jgi:hypothetical protein
MNFSIGLLWSFIIVAGLLAVICVYLGKLFLERMKGRYLNLKQDLSVIHREILVINQQMELEHLSDLVRWKAAEGILDHKASQRMLQYIWELKEEVRAQNTPV